MKNTYMILPLRSSNPEKGDTQMFTMQLNKFTNAEKQRQGWCTQVGKLPLLEEK